MSLYKTQRCRHFDEAGNPIKPYCSQGSKFIHPNDHQWAKLKRRNDGTPTPENREPARSKGKNKLQLSPGTPPRQRSSPLIPQMDLFKRKQKDTPREHDHRDWPVRITDRRRDSDSWVYSRERNGPFEQGYSLKRANDESDPYPNQRPRLSERTLYAPASAGGYNSSRYPAETNRIPYPVPYVSERNPETTTKVSDTFHRLAKEDKLKAFTGLSSELSRAVPDAAMAVTPALATVINGHTRTRERLENRVQELEALWKTLFSMLESDISKVIDSRLEHAMSLLDKERENALRVITRSQRFMGDGSHDGITGSHQRTDGRRETATDRVTVWERGAMSLNGGPTINASPEETRHHGGPTSLSLVPTQEGGLGTSLRIVLEDMKMQMDRQTRAIELLAQENHQLRSATAERIPPQLAPTDFTSSSPRKPSVLQSTLTASGSCNADTVDASSHRARDDPPQSPNRLPVAVVAQRRIGKTAAVGSPVRRSPRLSCLPPPRPSVVSQDTQDRDESSDESESVNDVAVHLFRDETPESDDLPPDEPSTALASRIIRAHDNPSPPPQDLVHPGINYVPGKDGQFPLPSVSVPPSPFRPINLLERLNQFSEPLSDPPRSSRTSTLAVQSDISGSGPVPPYGSISPEPSSPFIASVPMKSTLHEDLASAVTIPLSSTHFIVNDLPSRSSQHVCEPNNLVNDAVTDLSSQPIAGSHGQSITVSSPESVVPSSPRTQVVESSLDLAVPSASGDSSQGPFPCSERLQSVSKSSPSLPNANPPSNESSSKASPGTETVVPSRQNNDGEEMVDNNFFLKGARESKLAATSTKEVDANSRLGSLSPHSTNVLSRLCLPPKAASPIEQIILPAESIPIKHPSAPPPQTPVRAVTHPDFSRTSVQRPVIAPTPMRMNSARKLNSPAKFLLEVDNVCRTPAQRVPIGTALARGTPLFQRRTQLPAESDQSLPGRSLAIRAPVFTRPTLDNPSRSPAKRIAITDLAASPTRGHPAQSSPMRLVLRARSASVEPCPSGTTLARSRSVDPCAMTSKSDNHGKMKESVFPMVPILPRAGTKLPFPLVPGQRSISDLPPPIPEEHENAEVRNTGIDATQGKVTQSKTVSQLRQPSTSSRIPRIGNKPYARPPKNGKAAISATTANAASAPVSSSFSLIDPLSNNICSQRAPPFQLACKNGGVGNDAEVSTTQDQRLVGPLKRKRGAEATASANPHPIMLRQVVPGILNDKYAPKPAKLPSHVQAPSESSPPKVPQPLKFRKVVDGMLSARYAPAKPNLTQTQTSDFTSELPSPLSELSSSSNEEISDEKLLSTKRPLANPKGETSDTQRTDVDAPVLEPSTQQHTSVNQDADDKPSSRPRRTSRTRKPAQQQYVLDVFNSNTSTRPPPARRKPQSRTESDYFMGMSATALKALTTSNTAKNQQIVAILATEVIRKEGLRPESPTVKARTILQKQRDERDTRRRERAQRKAQMSEDGLGSGEMDGQTELDDHEYLDVRADHDENDCAMPQKHRRGPGDEGDYETPERPERILEPLKLEGVDRMAKPVKQVKWNRGLSTAVYLDEVDPKPKSLPNSVARGCLAPTSKNVPLDPLGNLVDMDNRPSPELVTEHIVVRRYLYDNDIEPEPIPAKMTRSKSKKSKS
ncbi:hypothetical protein JVT61DRAFT_2106 [Boletus reticuloceps]|uniref:Uncharacterized protein n=1 Tax=Boletus reticuloceps TaxID=495285 RepID=A0A8I2YSQ8_9AGAM|nr:hypothetical protein JVT61DRAFT_2106 [Boletus reticuloceps]